MTIVENIAWSEFLKSTIVTAQHGNDGNRIAMATKTLQQTTQQLVEVLNERARLFANSAQFDTALRDAAAIRALLPGSGLGYLCMGDVYCQQGHQSAAISIYDQGLEAVPESDQYYQHLQQERFAAISNNSKRVDFISQLPLDIVITNILPRVGPMIFSDSWYEILYVSRSWQERIVKQPNGLQFYFDKDVSTFKTGHAQLIRFAPHVQTLSGRMVGDAGLDDLFSRGHFSNLKKLNVNCAATTPRLPLMHGLEMIADSLTHLALFECPGPGLQLHDILETCPNLVFLEISHMSAVMSAASTSTYPKIKHLALCYQSAQARSHENMEDILTRFPSLRILEITPMPDSSLLPILHNHCPYLQAIFYHVKSSEFDVTMASVHPNRKGIASAYLYGDDYKQGDLIRFLHLQRDSLKVIHFRGSINTDDNTSWTLSSPFPRLLNLHFTSMYPSTTDLKMMRWILLNAPNLNTIHVRDPYFHPGIAKAMTKLKHLQKIDITLLSDDENDNEPHTEVMISNGIQQFLQHHITLGDRSTLEHAVVRMDNIEISEKRWIPLLARLTRLKKLELHTENISDSCSPLMLQIGEGCPALEELTFYDEEIVDNDLFMHLREHPNLKCLTIGGDILSDTHLATLCTFRNIKQLQISCSVPKDLQEMLQEHIPKVRTIDPYD